MEPLEWAPCGIGLEWRPWSAKGLLRRPQGVPKASQGAPKASQGVPKASQGIPKASPRRPTRLPKAFPKAFKDFLEILKKLSKSNGFLMIFIFLLPSSWS